MTGDADRHLLFGLLALQNGIINQGQLVAAFQAWTLDKSRSLADHLEARGDLAPAKRAVLEALAEVHLEAHGGDVEKSLAAVSAGKSTQESLARIGGPAVEGTLARVGSGSNESNGDQDRTMTHSVGTATSAGQRFRILRPHARGGLGAVFVALDGELNREVALKQILDHHADDPTSRQRFLIEAEITGGLEHPGIVPVYGLGTYDGGRPYYAMRFIRGDSLKEAIEEFHRPGRDADPGVRSLELRKLLRRFTDVCNAIEYAHSRGILHRDIKPGNVIVGRHGETLVVDWGLAKPLGKAGVVAEGGERVLIPSSASGSAETLPGSALGTPAYMSPEQAAGDIEHLGPRSDVYSLGATLYSLLTAKAPFGGDVGEVLRKVQKGDFLRPRQLDPSIDPALEAICLKAMATRPEDRYPTCRALADDVERWAADEPVTAWREPLARRARRWAKRNRTAVTAAVVALVASLAGLGAVTAVQTRANGALAAKNGELTRANLRVTKANADLADANTKVEARFELAREAIRAFQDGVNEDDMLKGEELKGLRNKLLRSAGGFYEKLEKLLQGQTDRPSRAILAQSYFELGDLTDKIGIKSEALAVHKKALAIRRELASGADVDSNAKLNLSRSLNATGWLCATTGDNAGALSSCEEALALSGPLAEGPGATDAARDVLGSSHSRIGSLLSRIGKTADALESYRRAHAIYQKLADENPAVTEFRSRLAMSQNDIGTFQSGTGKTADALESYRRAHAIYQKLADENPAVTEFRSRLAMSQNDIGGLQSNTGKTADALESYRRAIAIQQKLAEENPAVTEFRSSLAVSHNNIGYLQWSIGHPADALESYRRAIAIQQKLAEENPAVTEFRSRLALSHNHIGYLQSSIGHPADALESYRRAHAIQQKLAEENPAVTEFRSRLALSHNSIGWVQSTTGKTDEALESYRLALEILQKLVDDNPAVTEFRRSLAISHRNIGLLQKDAGKTGEALESYRLALEILQKLVDDNPAVTEFRRSLADSFLAIGYLRMNSGRLAEAAEEFAREASILEKLASDNPSVPGYRSDLANCLNNSAALLLRLGRHSDARIRSERATAILETLASADPDSPAYRWRLAEGYLRFGQARRAKGDHAGAASDWKRAIALLQAIPGLNGEYTFFHACCHAALAGLAGEDGAGISAAEASSQADMAMALLRKAAGLGYRNADDFRTETALDPLRSRDDFQFLMLDLAFPADPFAVAR